MNECCNTCPSIGGGDCPHATNCIGSQLPTIMEIVEIKKLFPTVSWACHSDESKICMGLVHSFPEGGYSKQQSLISPEDFSNYGWIKAIVQALTVKLPLLSYREYLEMEQNVKSVLRGSDLIVRNNKHLFR